MQIFPQYISLSELPSIEKHYIFTTCPQNVVQCTKSGHFCHSLEYRKDKLWCSLPSILINSNIGDTSPQCVHHSVQGRKGSHVTITHNALALTVQDPLFCAHPHQNMGPHWTWNPHSSPSPLPMRPHWTGTSSPPLVSNIWWPSTNICSNLYTSRASISADIWWLLKQVCLAQAAGTHPTGMLFCC